MMNANKRRTHPQPRDAAAAAIHWAEQSGTAQSRVEASSGQWQRPDTAHAKSEWSVPSRGKTISMESCLCRSRGCRGRGQFGAQFSSVNRHRQRQLTEAETEEDADWLGPYRPPLSPPAMGLVFVERRLAGLWAQSSRAKFRHDSSSSSSSLGVLVT